MTIKINTKNITITLLILQCIPPLFYIKRFTHNTHNDWTSVYGFYGFIIAACIVIVLFGLFVKLLMNLIDGDIVLFKERKIKLWRSRDEKNKIGELLEKYGQACLSKNEYEMDRWHRQLENLGYFK